MESRECPVSAITPESFEMVEQIADARLAGKAVLTPMLRSDARLFDAAAVIESCRIAASNACTRALRRES